MFFMKFPSTFYTKHDHVRFRYLKSLMLWKCIRFSYTIYQVEATLISPLLFRYQHLSFVSLKIYSLFDFVECNSHGRSKGETNPLAASALLSHTGRGPPTASTAFGISREQMRCFISRSGDKILLLLGVFLNSTSEILSKEQAEE